jgi:type II secretory pathway pseudopilin PulG
MKRERALTLIELLTVVVIVLLLLAIMLPVVLHFRKNAQKTHCINNLRQIGAAIQLYRADFGGTFPSRLSLLMLYIKTDEILVCPTEPAGNDMSAIGQVPTTYVTILRDLSDASASINTSHRDVQAAQLLVELDANHGVLVCVLHGRRVTDDDIYN